MVLGQKLMLTTKKINESGENTVYQKESETKGENGTLELDKQWELKIQQLICIQVYLPIVNILQE